MLVKLKEQSFITENPLTFVDETYTTLPAGMYTLKDIAPPFSPFRPAFEPYEGNKEGLIEFSEGVVAEIVDTCNKFLTSETKEAYTSLKHIHQMALFLYGPPGTGKTSTAFLAMNSLIKNYNAVAILCESLKLHYPIEAIKMMRKYSNAPVILFYDEVDDAIDNEETEWLQFLSGVDSMNNVIVIGCTNYIENIPDRIKNRRSRVKKCIEVNKFPSIVYKQYIEEKIPKFEEKFKAELAYKASEACLTLDQLKHVILDIVIDKVAIDAAIDDVKKTVITE